MTRETDVCSLRELYSLGGLTDREREAFEAHLHGCSECQTEVTQLGEISDWLLYDFEEVEVPSGLRDRVLTGVFADDPITPNAAPTEHLQEQGRSVRRGWSITWMGIAAAIIVSVVATWWLKTPSSQPVGRSIPSFLPGATATVALSTRKHRESLFMDFSGLQPVHGSQVYQVWLIKQGTPPTSAGVFVPDSSGQAVFAALVPSGGYHTVAVTLEPKAIDLQPLGTKVFAGTLG